MNHNRIQKYLLHIQQETRFVTDAISMLERDDLDSNPILCRALERSIETIGEATSKIRLDLEAQFPFVAWRKIVGMRNILAHVYWEVDLDLVWEVATIHLPLLSTQVTQILAELYD